MNRACIESSLERTSFDPHAGGQDPLRQAVVDRGRASGGDDERPVIAEAERIDGPFVDQLPGQPRGAVAADADFVRHVGQQGVDLFRRTGRQEPAAADQHEGVRDRLDFVQDVAGEQEPSARTDPPLEQFRDFVPPHGVQPVERLVEDQQLGVVGQGLGQHGPLSHASRVSAHAAVHGVFHADQLHGVLGPRGGLAAAEAVEPHQVRDPIEAAHAGIERVAFRADAEAAEQLAVVHRAAVQDPHAPDRRPQLAGDQVQERRFARAVGPQ